MVAIPLVFAAVIIWIAGVNKRKHDQMLADLYAKALEQGRELPPELLSSGKKKNESLKTGIILIAIGIGISLFMYFVSPENGFRRAAAGLVPLFAGVGLVAVHIVWKRLGYGDEE